MLNPFRVLLFGVGYLIRGLQPPAIVVDSLRESFGGGMGF